jgi:SH3-like domain-containing protein
MLSLLFAMLTVTNFVQFAASSAASKEPAAESIQTGQNRPVQALVSRANAGETSCTINAYVFDIHPNGINVRTGAGKTFDILGQIKPDENGVIVEVIASSEPWLKIENAERIEGDSPFSGNGWVFSSQLAMNTRMKAKLYSRSNTKSKVLANLPEDEEVTLVACKGDWAKVRYGQYQGWLKPEAQCGSPVTSCS